MLASKNADTSSSARSACHGVRELLEVGELSLFHSISPPVLPPEPQETPALDTPRGTRRGLARLLRRCAESASARALVRRADESPRVRDLGSHLAGPPTPPRSGLRQG